MKELLCLKWNNHYSAFLKLLSSLHLKDLYCDATIACHGKYYPVHRMILSTCSEYFEEIFNQMKCKHPFIIVKDVNPKELEALLNYMYKGEVNVSQEALPELIKAAEGLRIKGLAVPDGTSEEQESHNSDSQRKRSNKSHLNSPQMKKRKTQVVIEQSDTSLNEIVPGRSTDSDMMPKQLSGLVDAATNHVNSVYVKEESDFQEIESHASNLFSNEDILEQQPVRVKTETVEIDEQSNYADPGLQYSPTESELEREYLNSASEFNSSGFFSPNASMSQWASGSNVQEEENSLEILPSSFPSSPTEARARFPLSHHNPAHFGAIRVGPKDGGSQTGYKCSFCPREYTTKSAFNMHYLYKHSNQEKRLACNFCPYRCFFNNELVKHQRKHTGEKPYHCHFCPHKASQKNNLDNHIKICHGSQVT